MRTLTIERQSINEPVLVGDTLWLPTNWCTFGDTNGDLNSPKYNSPFVMAVVFAHNDVTWHRLAIFYQQDGHWITVPWDTIPEDVRVKVMQRYLRYGPLDEDDMPWDSDDALWVLVALEAL